MDMTLLTFVYINHKGKVSRRKVKPIRIWFGSTAWHREAQWLLEAFDVDKQETRDFALCHIASPMDPVHQYQATHDLSTDVAEKMRRAIAADESRVILPATVPRSLPRDTVLQTAGASPAAAHIPTITEGNPLDNIAIINVSCCVPYCASQARGAPESIKLVGWGVDGEKWYCGFHWDSTLSVPASCTDPKEYD